ncbi:phage tail assembly chaperone G [Oceanobacillus caeni]
MANLKRTYIELVKNPEEALKGGEIEIEKIWTPPFLPWKLVRQSIQTLADIEKEATSEIEIIDKLEEIVANDIFMDAITVEDLRERLHAPDGIGALRGVVEFVAQGNENDETKEFLAKKD